MGPWSEETHLKRATQVKLRLEQGGLNSWAEGFWKDVLHRLAKNEEVYNARVKEVYSKIKRKTFEGGS